MQIFHTCSFSLTTLSMDQHKIHVFMCVWVPAVEPFNLELWKKTLKKSQEKCNDCSDKQRIVCTFQEGFLLWLHLWKDRLEAKYERSSAFIMVQSRFLKWIYRFLVVSTTIFGGDHYVFKFICYEKHRAKCFNELSQCAQHFLEGTHKIH